MNFDKEEMTMNQNNSIDRHSGAGRNPVISNIPLSGQNKKAAPLAWDLLIRHELNLIAVRAEPVEAQESIHISTNSKRTGSRINSAGSIVNPNNPLGRHTGGGRYPVIKNKLRSSQNLYVVPLAWGISNYLDTGLRRYDAVFANGLSGLKTQTMLPRKLSPFVKGGLKGIFVSLQCSNPPSPPFYKGGNSSPLHVPCLMNNPGSNELSGFAVSVVRQVHHERTLGQSGMKKYLNNRANKSFDRPRTNGDYLATFMVSLSNHGRSSSIKEPQP